MIRKRISGAKGPFFFEDPSKIERAVYDVFEAVILSSILVTPSLQQLSHAPGQKNSITGNTKEE